jgi:hypothetical protein
MIKKTDSSSLANLTQFDRKLVDSSGIFTYIGSGSIGGKASGLAFIKDSLISKIDPEMFPDITVGIPTMTVLATDVFDQFMSQNKLYDVALSDARDDEIAAEFVRADLPADVVGDLMTISKNTKAPLALRSSSLFEDALHEPFAGVYGTKMVPNNQFDPDTRFKIMVDAIKFVYASTFFKEAKDYIATTGQVVEEEKMAVIIQEVVGHRYGDRYYPEISGVARSYNYYRTGNARPEDGIVSLALGLGKTIVDSGKCWNYSPTFPHAFPPYINLIEMLKATQTQLWAVNMGKPPEHDPIHETEYLVTANLQDAEKDQVLKYLVSTYDYQNDRLSIGMGDPGPRILTFAPILDLEDIPLNKLVKHLLKICEEVTGHQVEIEFAMTIDPQKGTPARFGFLQVRPMFVSKAMVNVALEDLDKSNILVASEDVLGNGSMSNISNVVYLTCGIFNEAESRIISSELEQVNHQLIADGAQYLLIVYGRLGTTDPPFGIPVNWWQISGAKVIVEASLPEMSVELSQGSHFFHNVISSQVGYFSMPRKSKYKIDWEWLNSKPAVQETGYVRHIKLDRPLQVKIDGANGRGVIYHEG